LKFCGHKQHCAWSPPPSKVDWHAANPEAPSNETTSLNQMTTSFTTSLSTEKEL